jgi:type II secretory pathway component PulK
MALVVALVTLAALSVIISGVAVQLFAQRQSLTQRHNQLQATWLARAGVELAAARLLDKPAPFSEDNQELLAKASVRIVVEKEGPEVYSVRAEAKVGPPDRLVVRTAQARFRRMTSGGIVRLENLSAEPLPPPKGLQKADR